MPGPTPPNPVPSDPLAPGSAPPPPPENPPPSGGGRSRRRRGLSTSWMAHVKATMRAHRGMSLRDALRKAKLTYKKSMRGGGNVGGLSVANNVTPGEYGAAAPAVGGRRRKSRRTRRGGMYD